MELTKHFTLEELVHSDTAVRHGIDNTPTPDQVSNLTRLAETLEDVRKLLGDHPITITSGFRNEATNRVVGGAWGSAHLNGLAADFVCPDFGSPRDICRALEPHMRELGIDQLIIEYDRWVHLGLAADEAEPRNQALTIDKHGTRGGFA